MSGSLTWREYESDHGTLYSIQVDKSNANLLAAFSGEILTNKRGFNWKLPPKSLILRRLHCFAQFNPKIRRSFIVGNKKVISGQFMEIGQEYISVSTPTAGDLGVAIWVITGYTGEKFSAPTYINNADTGLDDGTPFMNV